ncbi:MAG: tetratricopeptide repeat protein [Verrucomicrobia bacterium]|nr:tetratricopeptide repeat protein [Verrucomicrobiota bacterium]
MSEIHLPPQYAPALNKLLRGDTGEALQMLNAQLLDNPTDAVISYFLSAALLQSNEVERAHSYLSGGPRSSDHSTQNLSFCFLEGARVVRVGSLVCV